MKEISAISNKVLITLGFVRSFLRFRLWLLVNFGGKDYNYENITKVGCLHRMMRSWRLQHKLLTVCNKAKAEPCCCRWLGSWLPHKFFSFSDCLNRNKYLCICGHNHGGLYNRYHTTMSVIFQFQRYKFGLLFYLTYLHRKAQNYGFCW